MSNIKPEAGGSALIASQMDWRKLLFFEEMVFTWMLLITITTYGTAAMPDIYKVAKKYLWIHILLLLQQRLHDIKLTRFIEKRKCSTSETLEKHFLSYAIR